MKLSADQLKAFDEQGYVFLPNCFSEEEIALLRIEGEQILKADRQEVWREKTGAPRTAFAAHTFSEVFRLLVRHPRLVEPLRQYFGEDVYVHQFKLNAKAAFEGDVWQWHQDYGTWARDDGMPQARAMNIAVFLDEVMADQRAAAAHPRQPPAGRVRGRPRQAHHVLSAVDARQGHGDAALRRRRGRARRQGIVAPTGKPGSVLMFHGNLVHASPPNITPYPRKIVYVTFCACSNHITKFTRAEWIAHRDFTPIEPVGDDALAGIRPRPPRRGGMILLSAFARVCAPRNKFADGALLNSMLQRTQVHFFSRDRHRTALQSPRFALLSRMVGCHEPGRGRMYKLYSMRRSGNCYKVRLALAQLDIPHELIEIDILQGETRTPEFLNMNPSGHVPLLEVAPGRYIAESNAILWYIAGHTPLLPEDRADRAEMLQWMFFEQHSLEPNLGAAYFWLALVKGGRELQQHALEDWMEEGYRALGVMEKHLATRRFFCRRPLFHRRHRALRLHPPGAPVRLRSRALSGGARLARPRRRPAHVAMDWQPAMEWPRRFPGWRAQ